VFALCFHRASEDFSLLVVSTAWAERSFFGVHDPFEKMRAQTARASNFQTVY